MLWNGGTLLSVVEWGHTAKCCGMGAHLVCGMGHTAKCCGIGAYLRNGVCDMDVMAPVVAWI